jgi:hypothetical protein
VSSSSARIVLNTPSARGERWILILISLDLGRSKRLVIKVMRSKDKGGKKIYIYILYVLVARHCTLHLLPSGLESRIAARHIHQLRPRCIIYYSYITLLDK